MVAEEPDDLANLRWQDYYMNERGRVPRARQRTFLFCSASRPMVVCHYIHVKGVQCEFTAFPANCD